MRISLIEKWEQFIKSKSYNRCCNKEQQCLKKNLPDTGSGSFSHAYHNSKHYNSKYIIYNSCTDYCSSQFRLNLSEFFKCLDSNSNRCCRHDYTNEKCFIESLASDWIKSIEYHCNNCTKHHRCQHAHCCHKECHRAGLNECLKIGTESCWEHNKHNADFSKNLNIFSVACPS